MSRTVSHYDERPESKVIQDQSLISDGVSTVKSNSEGSSHEPMVSASSKHQMTPTNELNNSSVLMDMRKPSKDTGV